MYRTYLRYKKLCIQYEYGTVSTVPAEVDFTKVQAQCANNIMQSLYYMQLLLQRRN